VSAARVWQYRVSRFLGRLITRTAAVLTLGRMPPFVSTSAIVVDDGRLLAVVDPIRKEAVLPGGHLTWRESPQHAVVREVREETGCEIDVDSLFGVFSGQEWTGERGVVRVVYTAHVTGGYLASSAEGHAIWTSPQGLAHSSTRDAPLIRTWISVQEQERT